MKHPPTAQKKFKKYYTKSDKLLYNLTKKYPGNVLDGLIDDMKHTYNGDYGYNNVRRLDTSTYVQYYLKKKYPIAYRQMVRALLTPQENMPLLINSDSAIMRMIAVWRLRQGK